MQMSLKEFVAAVIISVVAALCFIALVNDWDWLQKSTYVPAPAPKFEHTFEGALDGKPFKGTWH